jgi:hypothetical protein
MSNDGSCGREGESDVNARSVVALAGAAAVLLAGCSSFPHVTTSTTTPPLSPKAASWYRSSGLADDVTALLSTLRTMQSALQGGDLASAATQCAALNQQTTVLHNALSRGWPRAAGFGGAELFMAEDPLAKVITACGRQDASAQLDMLGTVNEAGQALMDANNYLNP